MLEVVLIIILAPVLLTIGVALIGVLLDPRVWLMALIIGLLLFAGLSLKASVVKHEAAVTFPELSCESGCERRHS